MKRTFLREEMNQSLFLMELKGNASCGAECQLDPVLGSPLKGSHVTYVNHWGIVGLTHIYTNTSRTHRTQWIKCDFQVLHIHIHADSQQWHTQCSICQPGLTSQVERPKHAHKYCIHLHTVTHTDTNALLATSATQRKSALLRIKTKRPKPWRDVHVFSSVLISFSFSGSLQSLWFSLSLPSLPQIQVALLCWWMAQGRARPAFLRLSCCLITNQKPVDQDTPSN